MSDDASKKNDVSFLLQKAASGVEGAEGELFQIVYDELKRIARWRMQSEKAGNTLQATALVNEAYLRLLGDEGFPTLENRRHFFGAAAEAMRRVLIDRARKKNRLKHGGEIDRTPLTDDIAMETDDGAMDILALNDALESLEKRDERKAAIVKHRYFLGLTVPETAECLGVSPRTVDDEWRLAKAWIKREMSK